MMAEERARILKLLEEGKITADQAARLIEALGVRPAEPGMPPIPSIADIRVRGRHFRQFDRIPDIVAAAVRSGIDAEHEDTEEFEGKRSLSVKTVSGDVSVEKSTEDHVRVSYSGGMVKVRSRGDGVQVRSVSGDVEARMPLAGTLEAETVSGDIDVDGAGAVLVLKSVSGDVSVETTKGEVNAGTVSGDINLDGFEGRVELRSKSGDVDIKATGVVAGLAESKSGDITVSLPRGVDLELELEIEGHDIDDEVAGDIKLDLGAEFETLEQREGFARLRLGAGGKKLVCRTRAADITVRQSEEQE
jgi:DUF4097 and DUF4098 domain-containing protein YvlB